MTVSDNINALLALHNIDQESLARYVGVTPAAVSKWLSGKSKISYKNVELICSKFHLEPNDILSNDKGLAAQKNKKLVPNQLPVIPSSARKVPLVHIGHLNKGDLMDTIESTTQYVEMPEDIVMQYPKAFALHIEDSCMTKSIPPGYDVLVNPATEAPDGSIVIVRNEQTQEILMRRLRKGNTSAMLVSDSCQDHPDIIWHEADPITLIGIVVWSQREFT